MKASTPGRGLGWWAGFLILLTITLPGPAMGSVDGMRWLGLGVLAAMGWFVAGGLHRELRGFGLWALALLVAIPGTAVPWAGAEAVIRVLCLVGVVMLARHTRARAWLGWLCAALLIQAGLAIAQRVGMDPLASILGMPASIHETGDLRYAVHGTQGHRNLLAGLLVAGAPLVWIRMGWNWGAIVAAVAMATGSQGAILGLLGAVGMVGVARFRGGRRIAIVLVGLVGLGAGVGWMAHSGAQGRESIWPQSVDMVAQSPWRGVGPGGFSNGFAAAERHRLKTTGQWDTGGLSAKHAHNEVLHAAATAGIPGAVGLVAAWGIPLVVLFRRDEWDDASLAGLATTSAVLTHSMVSFPLSVVSPALVAALGLGMALGPVSPAASRGMQRWLAYGVALTVLCVSTIRWLADGESAAAQVHLRAEQWSQAHTAGLSAMSLFPDDPTAAYRAAMGAWRSGQLAEAEALFRESLRANDHHVGRRDLGLLLAERGQAEESIEWLNDYLLIHPGSSSRAWMVLGAQHLILKDPGSALESFIHCQCPEGFLSAGRLLYAANRIPDALYRWRQVGDERGWLRIVEHHGRNAEWVEAQDALEQIEDPKIRQRLEAELTQMRSVPGEND